MRSAARSDDAMRPLDADGRARYHEVMAPDDPHSEPSAWQAAIDFGIDVTLLEENLKRTPAQRLQQLAAMNRFHAEVQARTVPAELRLRLEAERLKEKWGDLLKWAP